MSRGVANMTSLAESAEVVVASVGGIIVGAVAYVGTGKVKAGIFKVEWPIIRMLVVKPDARGQGIGRALTEECVKDRPDQKMKKNR